MNKLMMTLGLAFISSNSLAGDIMHCSGRTDDQIYQVSIFPGIELDQAVTITRYSLINRTTPSIVGQYSVVQYGLPARSPSGGVTIFKDQNGDFKLVMKANSTQMKAVLSNGQEIYLNLNCIGR